MNLATALAQLDALGPCRPFREVHQFPWSDPAFSAAFLAHSTRSALRTGPEVELIWHALELQPGHCLLDLGCGAGRHLLPLAARGLRCAGIDAGPAAIDAARAAAQKAGLKLALQLGDLMASDWSALLPPGVAGWDAILLSFGQLSCFPRAGQVGLLQRISSALRPGGRVLVEMLTPEELLSMQGHRSWWFDGGAFPPHDGPQLVLEEIHVDEELGYAHRLVAMGADGSFRVFGQAGQFHDLSGYHQLFAEAGLVLERWTECGPEELMRDELPDDFDRPGHPDGADGLWLGARRPEPTP